LDRYILARTRALVEQVTAQMDSYQIPEACESIREYLDVLTNWYVRSARDRFWTEEQTAFNVLYTVLETLMRVVAPLAPLTAEEIWRGLTGGRSVHLADWPDVSAGGADDDALPADLGLLALMERAREVCSAALALRKAHGQRVRQPLRQLVVADADAAALGVFAELIASEVNVKDLKLIRYSELAAHDHHVFTRLEVNARAAGPRLGRAVQDVIKAAKAGSWRHGGLGVVVTTPAGDVELGEGEFSERTVVEDEPGASKVVGVLRGAGFVVLDLRLDEELVDEGYARDMVRLIQDERKAAGLHVSDRIDLALDVPAPWAAAVRLHADMIQEETLAQSFVIDVSPTDVAVARVAKVKDLPK
jgi:isoleucyl-tRNA synthetase